MSSRCGPERSKHRLSDNSANAREPLVPASVAGPVVQPLRSRARSGNATVNGFSTGRTRGEHWLGLAES
jgi:hypothetical protein